jgi:hypothetical protein
VRSRKRVKEQESILERVDYCVPFHMGGVGAIAIMALLAITGRW